jgi:hypothetical protein
MQSVAVVRLTAVVVITLTAACASLPESPAARESSRSRHAFVLTAAQLHERGGDLLGMMTSRISSMRVMHTRGCPVISIRGRKTLAGISDPGIYVDGQRAGDTCILTMLSPTDLARIEVYPMGVTSRSGYHMDSSGLILIFTRRAEY